MSYACATNHAGETAKGRCATGSASKGRGVSLQAGAGGSGGRRQQAQHQQQHEIHNTPYGHVPAVGSAIAQKTLSPRKRKRLGMEGEETGGSQMIATLSQSPPPLLQPPAHSHDMSSGAGGCDAHFIVHLFVTAIADGKMHQALARPRVFVVCLRVFVGEYCHTCTRMDSRRG